MGGDDAALRIFNGMIEAATYFEDYRLPELFTGLPRSEYHHPIRYPVACHPQAWSAGTVPYLITKLLGLVPEALDRRLRIVRPLLPDIANIIHVRGLRVGEAVVDINFERTSDGKTMVTVPKLDGDLDVVVGVGVKA